MREILFRGKRIDNGEWVEGSLVHQTLYYGDPVERYHIIYDGEFDYDYYNNEIVIPETVGQYTGLRDCKRTEEYPEGQMIFEGDILRIAKVMDGIGCYYHPPLEYPVDVVVKWDMCAWMWETLCEDKRYIGFPGAWCHYECEVIGNIHDNPELLKGGEGK